MPQKLTPFDRDVEYSKYSEDLECKVVDLTETNESPCKRAEFKEDFEIQSEKSRRKNGCYNTYLRILTNVTHQVDISLETVAKKVIHHPFICLAICVAFIGVNSLGVLRFSSERRSAKLYIPQNSQTEIDQERVSKHFYTFQNSRLEEFGFFPKIGTNFLVPECVQEAKEVIRSVLAIPQLEDLCIKKPEMMTLFEQYEKTTNCTLLNPFEVIKNTSKPLKDLNAGLKNNITLMSNGKLPIHNEGDMIARVTKRGDLLTGVELLRVRLYLQNQNMPEEALKWEENYLNLMNNFDKGLRCASLLYSAHRSLDDAIHDSARGDLSLLSVVFFVMTGFAALMLGKVSNPVRGHCIVAIFGIITTGLGIGTGFALSLGIGTPFVSIVGILPFLVLSIGIDDIFIIVDEFDKPSDEKDPIKRIPMTIRKVGSTIAMTTLTDICAFAIGISSDFPAIRYFCIYASIMFAYVFLLIITAFIVFLYLDALRIKSNRIEFLPCLKAENSPCCMKNLGSENLANVVARKYAILLMKWPSKVTVMVITTVFLSFGIYGCFNVSQEFTKTTLLLDGSYMFTYLDKVEVDFDTGQPVGVYSLGLKDYADNTLQDQIKKAGPAAFSTGYYQSKYISWLNDYKQWSESNAVDISGANFTKMLPTFLALPWNARYFGDIKFNDQGKIVASRTHVFMVHTRKSLVQQNAMQEIRRSFSKQGIPLIPYADHFVYYENYASVVGEVTRNTCLATVAVLIITLPFCVNPMTVLMLVFGFVLLLTELIGLMYFWNISINSVSMMILVMSVGFAIDYSAHVAHAFMLSRKSSVNERVIEAVSSIGASVFMGGASTFLGMSVTAFASSELFRIFFRMVLGIVVFGLFNGLALLPVLFSIFGFLIGPLPHPSDEN